MCLRTWLLSVVVCLCSLTCYAEQRVLYMLHCGGCHLADGRGNPPEVPSIRDELGKIVAVDGGRDYLVQVPGASQAPVTDRELTDIVNWILAEFNADTLQDGFKPLSVKKVKRARRQTLADPLKRREEIWQAYLE